MNAELVKEYYLTLQGCDPARVTQRFLTDDYVEHQASAGFSRAGLLDSIRLRRSEFPGRKLIVHRAIEDGDRVFLHVEEILDASRTCARGELFRLSGGRIAEHWGAEVLDVRARKNPHGTFDGPDVNRRSTLAADNAARFQALDACGFNDWDFGAFLESRTPRYLQHSPTGRDTVHGLIEILKHVKGLGITMTMKNYQTLAAGDFLVTHRLYRTSPPFPEFRVINVFDLFRFEESGRVDEHWDIMEEIASEADVPRIFGPE